MKRGLMRSTIGNRVSLRRVGSEEHGTILILVAVTMVAFLGLAALAIDIGSFYQAQRQAQSAADAGALAGADALATTSAAAAATVASNMAKTNFSSADTAIVSQPTLTSIKVTVNAPTSSFFGRFIGLTSNRVSVTATAAETSTMTPCATAGNTCYAIFAMDQSCSSNGFTGGGGIHITGGVHSNGSMNVGGGGSSFGATTYGNTSGCTVTPSGYTSQNNTFTSGPLAQAPITRWPIDYTLDFPACSGSSCTGPCSDGTSSCVSTLKTPSFCTQASNSSSTWQLDSYYPFTLVSNQIYCDVGTGTPSTPSTWNGTILANQTGSGTIESTYVAGIVQFGGGSILEACGYALSGYVASSCNTSVPAPAVTNYPLAYATQSGTSIDASSGGGNLTGDLFAPNGTIDIGGGSSTSFLEGQDVNWSGGGITGDGPNSSGTGTTTGATSSLIQ
jgi:Flp pilus assembly protein TadG